MLSSFSRLGRYIGYAGALLPVVVCSVHAQGYRDPDESRFTIVNVDAVNSPKDEYAPFVSASGRWLYFTSSRTGNADLFRSGRNGVGWGEPVHIDDPGVNTRKDDGAFSMPIPAAAQLHDLDAEMLRTFNAPRVGVITGGKRRGAPGDADIYLVSVDDQTGTFSDVESIAAINTNGWESQPAIAPDGSYIIFSAIRNEEELGKDLFISTRGADGTFGEPVNLGERINTSGNEVAPFIAPDGRTLYFSSDGHGGMGGADIFMSRRSASGEWGEPVNLGERINTAANELFFYGVGRRACYFASDRPGGKGGFDIYRATPNIFAPDYSLVRVRLNDTLSGTHLTGRLKVNEGSLGITLDEYDVSSDHPAEIPLLSGFAYWIEASVPSINERKGFGLEGLPGDTVMSYTVNFGVPPPPEPPPPPPPPAAPPRPPVFATGFDDVRLPLFVSGYYRPNVLSTLQDLKKRQTRGDLKTQTYIADVSKDNASYSRYETMARRAEEAYSEFAKRLAEDFPQYLRYLEGTEPTPDEHLEITVRAYADPRPIEGLYNEKPVTFLDSTGHEYTVQTGEPLDNFKLAGLRAFFTMQYLDQVLGDKANRRNDAYIALMKRGAITWRAISGNVSELVGDDGEEDEGTKRRIRVEFRRVGPDGVTLSDDVSGGS